MCPSDRIARPSISTMPEFRPAFDVLDADRDGKISCDDLRMFYAEFSDCRGGGSSDIDEAITTMISAADSNKNGFVEYDEFEVVLRRISGEMGGNKKWNDNNNNESFIGGFGVMEDVFKVMDKDGDGRLSAEDLKSYMESAGFGSSDEEIKAMMRLAGSDDKEGVSYDDLLNIFGC